MINVIVPIVENEKKFEEFVNQNSKNDVKFFVGIRQSLAVNFKPKAKNVNVFEFADRSKREEIINSLQSCGLEHGSILIARRPLSVEEFARLTTTQKDMAILNPKHNKFTAWFKKMGAAIIKKVFAFSYFQDISAVYYNENMFELISVCSNLSMASRINRFVGIEIEEIEAQKKSVNKERKRFKNALKFSLYTLFLLGSIAGVTLISIFTKPVLMVILAEILWLVIAVTLWVVALLNFSRSIAVGDLKFGYALKLTESRANVEEKQPKKTTTEKTTKPKSLALKPASTTKNVTNSKTAGRAKNTTSVKKKVD